MESEKDTFGSPDEGDSVADLERIIDDSSKEYAEIAKELLREMAPRSLGSKRVSTEDQKAEWRLMRDRPEIMAQFFAQQGLTPASAERYAIKMEKLLGV